MLIQNRDMEEKAAPVFEKASLRKVFSVIEDRKKNPKEGSYVSGLMKGGIDRILKKIGEEAGEVVIAAKNRDKDELVYELTDLWFHSMVLLCEAGLQPQDISDELKKVRAGARKSTRRKVVRRKTGRPTVLYCLLPLGGLWLLGLSFSSMYSPM